MTALVFAFGAGLLATVNPCGFALLPAFVAVSTGGAKARSAATWERLARGLATGLAVSAGFSAVFVVAASLLAVGLRGLLSALPIVAVLIGIGLVALGIAIACGLHVGVRLASLQQVVAERTRGASSRSIAEEEQPAGRPSRVRGALVFGVAYALASLSCTVAVLLALVAQALASGSWVRLLGVLVAYVVGASLVLCGASVALAVVGGAVLGRLRRLGRIVDRLAGGLLALSGASLVVSWLPGVLRPGATAPDALTGLPRTASGSLSTVLAAHQGAVAAVAATAIVVAVVSVAARSAARGQRRAPVPSVLAATEKKHYSRCCDPTPETARSSGTERVHELVHGGEPHDFCD